MAEKRYVEVVKDDKNRYMVNAGYDRMQFQVLGETLTLSDIIKVVMPDGSLTDLREKILQGLAQGYCTEENKHKVLDDTLCKAQADAILTLLAEEPKAKGGKG